MPPCSGQSRPSPPGGREDAASLDRPCARRLRELAVGMAEYSRRGSYQSMRPKRAKKPTISNRWFSGNFRLALTICEALPSCRGLRARHAQKEGIGSWEVPRLTSGNVTPWPASGRRGAAADDARTWEVGLCRKSCEAGEQGGAIRCGVGGAKGRDQGECGSAKHAPGSGTGKCVTGAGTHTASCEAKEEGKVHHALPPHQCRTAQAGVFRNQEGRCARGGRPDVAGLRGRPRSQYRRPA